MDKEFMKGLNTTPAQHTGGNWCMSKYSPCDFGIYSDKGSGRDIALVRGQHDNEEAQANALLIRSAPEMLETLQAIVARINGEYDHPALLKQRDLNTSVTEDVLRYAERAIYSVTNK